MSKPLYHHLLIVRDWEILHNQLLATHEEIEPALRLFATEWQEYMNWSASVLEEILSAKDLSELRDGLEDNDMSVYVDTLEAP